MRYTRFVLALAIAVLPARVSGQSAVTVQTAAVFESYGFDVGLGIDRVYELSVPVGVNIDLGRFGSLALSSGYARVYLVSDDDEEDDIDISGALDTEARLSINLIPGRLIALFTGSAPTGVTSVVTEEVPLLGLIASDIIGFASSNLGTGGNVGGGLVGAVPLGKMALGFGATFKQPMEYEPISDNQFQLRPGGEVRLRAGVEGPLAQRTYLRIAGVFARRGKDQVNSADRSAVGNRWIGYFALNQGVGSASLTAYAFDVWRGSPQVEATAVTAAVLPKGNLLAAGARLGISVARNTSITPRVEYRLAHAAPPDGSSSDIEKVGSSVRFGLDIKRRFSRQFALVLQGSRLSGDAVSGVMDVGFNGYRAALHLEVNP